MRALRPSCEIYSVARRNDLRWKWRHTGANGLIVDCAEEYERFVECVRAARERGYAPRAKWMGCTVLVEK